MAKKKTTTATVDTKGDDTKPKELKIGDITGQEWENVLIIASATQIYIATKNKKLENLVDGDYREISKNLLTHTGIVIESTIIEKYLNVDGVYSAATLILSEVGLGKNEYIKRPKKPKKSFGSYTDKTPKTDIMFSKMRISLKKAGGSRLMSGGIGDTSGVFEAALKFVSNPKNKLGVEYKLFNELKNTVLDDIANEIGSNSIKNLPAKMFQIAQAYYQKYVYLRYIDVYTEYMKKFGKSINTELTGEFETNKSSLLKKYISANDLKNLIPSNHRKEILDHLKAELIEYNPGLFSIYKGAKIENVDLIDDSKVQGILNIQIEDSFIDDAILNTANEIFKDATNKNAKITEKIEAVLKDIVYGTAFKKCCLFEAASGVYKFTGSDKMVVNNNFESVPTHIIKFSNNGDIKKIPIANTKKFYDSLGENDKVIIRAGFKTNNSTANSILNIMLRGVGIAKSQNKLSEYKSIRKRTLFERILERIVIEHDIKFSKQIFETILHTKSINENLFSDIKDAVKNKIKEFMQSLKSKIMSAIKYLLNKGLEFFMESFGVTVTGTVDVNIQF